MFESFFIWVLPECWNRGSDRNYGNYLKPIRSQCNLSLTPENVIKLEGFLTFSGGRERMHWKQMGGN